MYFIHYFMYFIHFITFTVDFHTQLWITVFLFFYKEFQFSFPRQMGGNLLQFYIFTKNSYSNLKV